MKSFCFLATLASLVMLGLLKLSSQSASVMHATTVLLVSMVLAGGLSGLMLAKLREVFELD